MMSNAANAVPEPGEREAEKHGQNSNARVWPLAEDVVKKCEHLGCGIFNEISNTFRHPKLANARADHRNCGRCS